MLPWTAWGNVLTDLSIKKQPPPERRREIPDGKIAGLYLVLQPSGAKSWAVRYRLDGTPRKLTIGPYPAVDLATARRRAQEALGDLAGGVDPAARKKAAREARVAEELAGDRVEAVAKLFVDRYAKRSVGALWARETERLLKVEVIPKLGSKRLGVHISRGGSRTAGRHSRPRIALHREQDARRSATHVQLGGRARNHREFARSRR